MRLFTNIRRLHHIDAIASGRNCESLHLQDYIIFDSIIYVEWEVREINDESRCEWVYTLSEAKIRNAWVYRYPR